MWYIQPVGDENVEPALREVYDQDIEKDGYVWNTSRVWSHRPEMINLWMPLMKTVRSHLRLRTYELATIAAAHAIGCVYCMLAHGAVLQSRFFTTVQLEAIVQDYHHAGLEPAEVAMMAYAEKIILYAYKVTPEDIDGLRAHGFSDTDILDIALTTAARSFFSKILDAVGAEPDEKYRELPPELQQVLAVGRPFG